MTSQVDRAIQLAHDQGETIIGLRRQLAEAERQRGDLLDACIAEDLAHNHRQTCEWCLAVGWDHPGCWEHAGLRAHAYKLRQAALASVRGDE